MFSVRTASSLSIPVLALVLGLAPDAPAQVPQSKVEKPAFQRFATDPPALTQPTLVSTAWVAANAGKIVLIDARDKAEGYVAGHLPGARHLPTKALRVESSGAPEELLPPEKLASVLGGLGIDADTPVVAYGEEKMADPAHVLLAMLTVGHTRVAVMEGGIQAWKAEKRALSTEAPAVGAKTYVPRASLVRAAHLDDVRRASASGGPMILDVRPAEAFRGEGKSTEARPGHIPGSINRPAPLDLAAPEAGLYFVPLEKLAADYAALGLKPSEPVILSCRTGHAAAQSYIALKYLLGYEDVRWYDGSWQEWAAHAELPAAVGPK